MSNPASRSARAFCSSRALHQMKSLTSGWSTSRITILAARRVLPPDLIVPAEASAPRMELTRPLGVPPPATRPRAPPAPPTTPPAPLGVPPRASGSRLERILLRLIPEPEPPLKIVPSSTYQLRIELIVSSTARMKHALHCCGVSGTPTLNHA